MGLRHRARLLESAVITPALLATLMNDFALDPTLSVHGPSHWANVRDNGLELAPLTGAQSDIVELFAVLHDCRRQDEFLDPGHGPRAADYLRTLDLPLTNEARALLGYAVRYHADGLLVGDITVQTCWDADRLDLGRVGIVPRAERLCTDAARSLVQSEAFRKR